MKANLSTVLAVLLSLLATENLQAHLRENFEGPQTTWRYVATDANFRLAQQRRAQTKAHWGHGCEELRFAVGHGTYVYFEHDIGRPAVIDELQASVWVYGDRPGVQLVARVVFPRAVDESTGQNITTLVRGTASTRAGSWEQLLLDDLPSLVARQARVMRLQLGRDIDERGAFLDRLLLNVFCSPGDMQLRIDDLEVNGYLASGQVASAVGESSPQVAPAAFEEATGPINAASTAVAERVELNGSTLTVGDRPFFPRIIEHRGEPFEYLKQLGFNGVRLFVPPTASQLADARRHGLWLVCPPPDVLRGETIGPQHDCVLAWQLGMGLDARHTGHVRQFADAVRRADGQTARPLIVGATEQLRTFSRSVDALVVDRRILGTPVELTQLGEWIASREQLARPGTPLWVTVQTQPLPGLVDQWSAGGQIAPKVVEPEQIRLLAYTAIAAGARGLLFASHERLDQGDEESQLRSQSLALLNLDLELIEPWLATCARPQNIRTSQPATQATMLASTHSHLLLATRIEPQTQHVAAGPPRSGLALVVPGVPDSTEAYVLTPAGLKPLMHQRVTGGVRVSIEEFGWVGTIVFTSDPLVYARLAQTSARNRARAAQLQQAIVTTMVARTKRQLEPLVVSKRAPPDVATAMTLVEANLGQCQRLATSGDGQAAYTFAARAAQSLAQIRRATWELNARNSASGAEQLTIASFETLGRLADAAPARAAGEGSNRLAGGDMENLQRMLDSGWRHFRRDVPLVRSGVDLSAKAPFSGRYALRLEAVGGAATDTQPQLEASPVWIRTSDMPVRAGDRIEIHGQVRVSAPLSGGGEGLLVYDSLAGRELGLRVDKANGWQEFALHRTATRDGTLNVSIELSGLGEAFVDNLEVVVVDNFASPANTATPSVGTASRLRDWFSAPR